MTTSLTAFALAVFMTSAAASSIKVRVVGQDGKPLAGVSVCRASWDCVLTQPDGFFYLEGKHLYFSRRGYSPVFRVFNDHEEQPVVMVPNSSTASEWRLPKKSKGKGVEIGGNLKVRVGKNAKVASGRDIDFWFHRIYYLNGEYMEVGGGPTWSSGLPPWKMLSRSVEYSIRDVEYPRKLEPKFQGLILDGIDARGRYESGRYWRWVGDCTETLSYENASPEAAQFFDGILETLCYRGHDAR